MDTEACFVGDDLILLTPVFSVRYDSLLACCKKKIITMKNKNVQQSKEVTCGIVLTLKQQYKKGGCMSVFGTLVWIDVTTVKTKLQGLALDR